MDALRAPTDLSGEWRYALAFGLCSVPFTAATYWQSGDEMSFGPVLAAAFLAGYLFDEGTGGGKVVGFRTGLVGALPVGWMVLDLLAFVGTTSSPLWFRGASVLVVGVFLAWTVALVTVAGAVSAMVGGWLAAAVGVPSLPAVGN